MFGSQGDADWTPFPNGGGERPGLPIDPRPMIKWGLIIGGGLLLLVLLNVLRQIYTDWLWFDSLGYRSVFVKILLTKTWLFVAGSILFALIITPNAVYAYRRSQGRPAMLMAPEMYSLIRSLTVWGIVLGILFLAAVFGSVLSGRWETLLRFINDVPFTTPDLASGVQVPAEDPVFHKNIGFFVFTLPVFSLLQGWLLGTLIVTMVSTAAIYAVNLSLRGVKLAAALSPQLIAHASVLLGAVLLVVTGGYWIDIYELVFSSGGVIFGASYADLNARLPALRILMVIGAIVGVLMLANAYLRSLRIILGGLGLWVAVAIVVGAVYPSLVQRFQVNPNELDKEREYIPRHVQFTRQGFALDRIVEEDYDLATIPSGELAGQLAPVTAETIAANPETIENVRLWDHRPLRSTYNQIQFFRAYYRFVDVDVDRYEIDGKVRQVVLGARELFSEDLGEDSQSWVNRRLQFTHGFGVAMSPATEFTPEGKPEFFIKDIPPRPGKESLVGKVPSITQAQIYYGENSSNYVLVNTKETEFDYPALEGDDPADAAAYEYDGDGGVRLSSMFRRAAYAWEFADINLLISGALNSESRLQYRRDVQDRVHEIAPFLRLDSDPYMVVADGGLFWIQDAYTVTSRYPYSDPYRGDFNYIRNSVKAVVDAYNGTVDFYIFDAEDAMIQTYARVFPKLFKHKDEMPAALLSHIRYPQDFFSIQAEKYLLYHMRDTTDFYRKEDPWSVPRELFFETEQDMEPYYAIMELPGEEKEEFVLLLPFTPLDKPNQVAWLAARSDDDRGQYGTLKSFLFPKGTQVDGPEQVEARIDNDFTIKQQFTLLCQRGARCIRGNLLVIPIVNGDEKYLLYVEPLYIQSENIAFPELKQVIVADAKRVAMAGDFQSALNALVQTTPSDTTGPGSGEPPGGQEPTTGLPLEDAQKAIEEFREALDRLEQALEELLKSTEQETQ